MNKTEFIAMLTNTLKLDSVTLFELYGLAG
jgi:hypothetical protein